MGKKGFFLKNGAAVLEQIIRSFDGNCNPIRTFSAKELEKATDNFNWSRRTGCFAFHQMYKGVHEGREIAVKRFDLTWISLDSLELIANEVAVASRMSNHKNVLKLLGCCLETELPVLVYEFPGNGNLSRFFQRDGNDQHQQPPFETKLKIALGIANAIAYLHHGLSKTFIHRDIQCAYVFLDQHYVAKLSEFLLSIPIPQGKTHVDDAVCGTAGHIPPEVLLYGRYTEKSDVYNFGILFGELLLGKRLGEFFSERIRSDWEDEWDGNVTSLLKLHLKTNTFLEVNRAQKLECAKLLERCLEEKPDDRPNMIQVGKALRLIDSIQH